MILGVAVATLAAQAGVLQPEAGKVYRIKHASGLYLTDKGMNLTVAEADGSYAQAFAFEPVAGKNNTYNIVRMTRKQYVGSDWNWNSTILSRNTSLSQFTVAESKKQAGYVTFKNVGLATAKSNAYLGTDDYTSDPKVYTDKAGTDVAKHMWEIEECDLAYDGYEDVAGPDKYKKDIDDSDPRKNVYPGYKLVFAEEFSKDGKPNAGVWNFETGFKRNHEHQYYNGNKNCYIQDGVLVIEARDELDSKIANPQYDGTNNWPSNIGKYLHWTSGSMTTQSQWDGGYSWMYGIYEVRAKVPQRVGCWPAIWSTGKQYEWPYCGEIDILEYYGGGIHGNVATGNGARWGAKWNSAFVADSKLGSNWGNEYHTWRMYWDYDHMELWCDDIIVNNINLDDTVNAIPSDSYDHSNGKNPFRDVRQMLWLNLAIGGDNGGDPSAPPYPNRFLVDYARVYQKYGTDGKATYRVDSTISNPSFIWKDGQENKGSGVEETEFLNPTDDKAVYYNLQGMLLQNPQAGQLVIERKHGKSTKRIY